MYNWVSKVIWALSCFSFLYCVLVPENLYHPLNQLDSKPKAMSVSIVLDFTLHSDWLFVIFSFLLIGWFLFCDSQGKSSLLHHLWDIHFYFLHSLTSPLPPSSSWCLFFDWMMVAEVAKVTQSIAYVPSIQQGYAPTVLGNPLKDTSLYIWGTRKLSPAQTVEYMLGTLDAQV